MKRTLPFIIIVLAIFVLVWSGFGRDFGRVGDLPIGNVGIDAIVNYADGTTEVIESKAGGLLPFAVYYPLDDSRVFWSIDFNLWGSFTYTGTVQSIYREASLTFDLDNDGTPEKVTAPKGTLSNIPTSGESINLASFTIQATEIESWAGSSGEYSAKVRGNAFLQVTFDDGTVNQLESSEDTVGTFQFRIEKSGATSALSLYLGAWPTHEPPEWK